MAEPFSVPSVKSSASSKVNDFKSLANNWSGKQTFASIPKSTRTLSSISPSSNAVNLKFMDDSTGYIITGLDDINGEIV